MCEIICIKSLYRKNIKQQTESFFELKNRWEFLDIYCKYRKDNQIAVMKKDDFTGINYENEFITIIFKESYTVIKCEYPKIANRFVNWFLKCIRLL